MYLRVVNREPVDDGDSNSQRGNAHIKEPVGSFDFAESYLFCVEVWPSLQPPSMGHEDGSQEGLSESEHQIPVGEINQPLF